MREFAARFSEQHGAITCRALLGCNLGTPEGFAYALEQRFHATRCRQYVQDAVEIVEKMITS